MTKSGTRTLPAPGSFDRNNMAMNSLLLPKTVLTDELASEDGRGFSLDSVHDLMV